VAASAVGMIIRDAANAGGTVNTLTPPSRQMSSRLWLFAVDADRREVMAVTLCFRERR